MAFVRCTLWNAEDKVRKQITEHLISLPFWEALRLEEKKILLLFFQDTIEDVKHKDMSKKTMSDVVHFFSVEQKLEYIILYINDALHWFFKGCNGLHKVNGCIYHDCEKSCEIL